MGPNERLFKKEYAKELFRIAENDLVTARVLSASTEVRNETTLFHVEQAIEKSLKSALCWSERPVPFTHDLYAIVQKFDQSDLPPGSYSLHDLTPFASIRRYEEGNYILTEQDIENALNLAEKVLNWVKGRLRV